MKSARFRSLVLLFVSCCAAAVFAQQAPQDPNSGPSDFSSDTAPSVPTDPNHVLQAQDILRVQVFQEEDINEQCKVVPVSQQLTISLPLIGVVSVKNKTIGQVQELVRQRYDKDYLVNPQVSVLVLKYADRSVNVMGSVTKQGRVEFPAQRDLSIVDAISLAGGQTRLADLKHVKLTRRTDDGSTEVKVVDVDAMMKQAGTEPVLLQPGDIVYVPERML